MIITGSSMPGPGQVKTELALTCPHTDQVHWREQVDHNPASPAYAHFALCLECRTHSMGLWNWVGLR